MANKWATHVMPEQRCPRCGYQMDRATRPASDGAEPTPGSLTVCIECGVILRFKGDMSFALAAPDDLVALFMTAPEEYELLRKVQQFFKGKRYA